MAAIARACQEEDFPASVATVIAPSGSAPALTAAHELGLHFDIVEPGDEYGCRLLAAMRELDVDMVCLAGFMRLLPAEVLSSYPNRVLNIHPALLPKFGGKGMYGHHVHEAVLASGDTESGCSVHFVTEQYDEGAVILQRKVPVLPDDTPESLAARILAEEHIAYPEAIKKVLGG